MCAEPPGHALSGSPELSPARACNGRLCVRHLARLRRADDRRLRPDRFRGLGQRAPDRRLPARDRDRDRRVVARRLAAAAPADDRLRSARVAIFAVLPFERPRNDRRARSARRLRNGLFPSGRSTPDSRTWCPTRIFRTRTCCSRRSRTSPGPSAPSWEALLQPPGPSALINSVTFLVSAALLAGIPDRLLQSAQAVAGLRARPHRRLQARPGLRAPWTVLAAWNVVMLATAGANVAEVVLAKETFDAGTSATASSSA